MTIHPPVARLLAVTLLTCLLYGAATAQVPAVPTLQDTLAVPLEETLPIDSSHVPIVPIPGIGSIDRHLPSTNILANSQAQFLEYRSLYEIIRWFPGIYLREQGSSGQFDGAFSRGTSPVAFMSDGVLLNDPLSGSINLNFHPSEQFERIEYIAGTRAFLYGLNSTGGLLNFVTAARQAIHPVSRLRYSESTYEYGFLDAFVSQDLLRGLNVTLGVEHPTTGGRFPNSTYDHWNTRARIRYDLSNEINIFASAIYGQASLGLNGGISPSTPDSLRFETIEAIIANSDAYEKNTRHDFRAGIAVRLDGDSNATSALSLYLTTNLREYRDEENRPLPNGILIQHDQRTQLHGIRFTHDRGIGDQRIQLGGEVQTQSIIASPVAGQHRTTNLSAFGRVEFRAAELFSVSPYARIDHVREYERLAVGADASLALSPFIQVFGGYSDSYRFATFQETSWSDSTIAPLPEDVPPEQHHLFEAGILYEENDRTSLSLTFFHRIVENAYLIERRQTSGTLFSFTNHARVIRQGVAAGGRARWGSLATDLSLQYLNERGDMGIQRLPRWSATGGIYFWDTLFARHLDLKTGLRGRFFTLHAGTNIDQQRLIFLPNDQSDISFAATIDFVLIARLGDAHIHLLLENILNRKYITTLFYPMPDRSIRFGLSWTFLD